MMSHIPFYNLSLHLHLFLKFQYCTFSSKKKNFFYFFKFSGPWLHTILLSTSHFNHAFSQLLPGPCQLLESLISNSNISHFSHHFRDVQNVQFSLSLSFNLKSHCNLPTPLASLLSRTRLITQNVISNQPQQLYLILTGDA